MRLPCFSISSSEGKKHTDKSKRLGKKSKQKLSENGAPLACPKSSDAEKDTQKMGQLEVSASKLITKGIDTQNSQDTASIFLGIPSKEEKGEGSGEASSGLERNCKPDDAASKRAASTSSAADSTNPVKRMRKRKPFGGPRSDRRGMGGDDGISELSFPGENEVYEHISEHENDIQMFNGNSGAAGGTAAASLLYHPDVARSELESERSVTLTQQVMVNGSGDELNSRRRAHTPEVKEVLGKGKSDSRCASLVGENNDGATLSQVDLDRGKLAAVETGEEGHGKADSKKTPNPRSRAPKILSGDGCGVEKEETDLHVGPVVAEDEKPCVDKGHGGTVEENMTSGVSEVEASRGSGASRGGPAPYATGVSGVEDKDGLLSKDRVGSMDAEARTVPLHSTYVAQVQAAAAAAAAAAPTVGQEVGKDQVRREGRSVQQSGVQGTESSNKLLTGATGLMRYFKAGSSKLKAVKSGEVEEETAHPGPASQRNPERAREVEEWVQKNATVGQVEEDEEYDGYVEDAMESDDETPGCGSGTGEGQSNADHMSVAPSLGALSLEEIHYFPNGLPQPKQSKNSIARNPLFLGIRVPHRTGSGGETVINNRSSLYESYSPRRHDRITSSPGNSFSPSRSIDTPIQPSSVLHAGAVNETAGSSIEGPPLGQQARLLNVPALPEQSSFSSLKKAVPLPVGSSGVSPTKTEREDVDVAATCREQRADASLESRAEGYAAADDVEEKDMEALAGEDVDLKNRTAEHGESERGDEVRQLKVKSGTLEDREGVEVEKQIDDGKVNEEANRKAAAGVRDGPAGPPMPALKQSLKSHRIGVGKNEQEEVGEEVEEKEEQEQKVQQRAEGDEEEGNGVEEEETGESRVAGENWNDSVEGVEKVGENDVAVVNAAEEPVFGNGVCEEEINRAPASAKTAADDTEASEAASSGDAHVISAGGSAHPDELISHPDAKERMGESLPSMAADPLFGRQSSQTWSANGVGLHSSLESMRRPMNDHLGMAAAAAVEAGIESKDEHPDEAVAIDAGQSKEHELSRDGKGRMQSSELVVSVPEESQADVIGGDAEDVSKKERTEHAHADALDAVAERKDTAPPHEVERGPPTAACKKAGAGYPGNEGSGICHERPAAHFPSLPAEAAAPAPAAHEKVLESEAAVTAATPPRLQASEEAAPSAGSTPASDGNSHLDAWKNTETAYESSGSPEQLRPSPHALTHSQPEPQLRPTTHILRYMRSTTTHEVRLREEEQARAAAEAAAEAYSQASSARTTPRRRGSPPSPILPKGSAGAKPKSRTADTNRCSLFAAPTRSSLAKVEGKTRKGQGPHGGKGGDGQLPRIGSMSLQSSARLSVHAQSGNLSALRSDSLRSSGDACVAGASAAPSAAEKLAAAQHQIQEWMRQRGTADRCRNRPADASTAQLAVEAKKLRAELMAEAMRKHEGRGAEVHRSAAGKPSASNLAPSAPAGGVPRLAIDTRLRSSETGSVPNSTASIVSQAPHVTTRPGTPVSSIQFCHSPLTPSPYASSANPTSAGAAQPTVLPFGQWQLVRVPKNLACDARRGTKKQLTNDGGEELFQCDQVLKPGALAVVIAHEAKSVKCGKVPKTWVFCPDPLCLDSQPAGSELPHWPVKVPLRAGTRITRTEYNKLRELGLDVRPPTSNATSSSSSMQHAPLHASNSQCAAIAAANAAAASSSRRPSEAN